MKLVRDKVVKDAYMNSTLQNMFTRGELRKDHPLQRKPDRWSKNDKDGLVASVIKGEDIDSIKICEQLTPMGVVLWLIDGLQRLTVLNAYMNLCFKLGKDVEFPIITYQTTIMKDGQYFYENVEYDLRGKGYDDLPIELKERLDNYKIDVVKHLDCTDEEIGYHMRRYNKQKSMNASESAITYMDGIAGYVKNISSNNRFFKDFKFYKETERANGAVERAIVESVMCMFHLDNWKKQTKQIGSYLKEKSSKEEFDSLNENLHRLENIVTEDMNDIFTIKDTFIWLTLFARFTELGLDDQKFADFLIAFKSELRDKPVDNELFDEVDKGKGTKDKAVILKKLHILETLMHEFFLINEEDLEEVDTFEFVKENVKSDVTEEDVEFYSELLDDLTLEVDNNTKLLDKHNRPSLVALVGYACENDIDLDEWIKSYFAANVNYILNQKQNLHMMINSLQKGAIG